MKQGSISLATGPMFSGKTEWLISKLESFSNKNTLAIRFALDTRYSLDSLQSHNGKKIKAKSATNISDIEKQLTNTPVEIIVIDEAQFFEPKLANFLKELKNKGMSAFAAGLNVDYLASPWETTEKIAQIADNVINLLAICTVCKKKNATITQRVNNSLERIVVGGSDIYEPRCFKHFINPEFKDQTNL